MTGLPDPHLSVVRPVAPSTPQGCEDRVRMGTAWVQLRLCFCRRE